MAGNILYSKEDIDKLLAIPENWVQITDTVLKKGTSVWDGTTRSIYKVIGRQTHPDLGVTYVLRDLHTGESIVRKAQDVHESFRMFQLGKEAQKLRETATQGLYRVYLVVQGQPYETEDKPTSDLNAAIAQANAHRIRSLQVAIVRNVQTGEIVHRADDPVPTAPGVTAPGTFIEDVISELRKRKTVKLTPELMIPGLIVKHTTAGEFYVYTGPSPNDKARHEFMNFRTTKGEAPIPAAIAEGLYQVIIPYLDDLVNLIPSFPRDAYAALVRLYGDVYKGVTSPAPAPTPTATPQHDPTVVDVSGTSRRTVGREAAERNIQKPPGDERYAVEYFQRNWTSPRFFDKGYKSEYQATRRAERLLAQSGVVWTAVVDRKNRNERVLVFPPGFDPDDPNAERPGGDIVYSIQMLGRDGNWSEYERRYKTLVPAQNRARTVVATSRQAVVRAEVIEMPANRLVHIVNLRGIDLKTYGIVQPDEFEQVEIVAGELDAAPDHTVRPTAPTPAPTPTPPPGATRPAIVVPEPMGKTPEESLRAMENIITLRPQTRRMEVRDELSLIVARKLIALACVSTISRYNVSVPDAVGICQENQERLEQIAAELANNEITLYDAIGKINDELVKIYDLTDLAAAPPVPPVEAPSGMSTQDIEPMMRHIARSVLQDNTISRVSLASGKSGRFTEGDLHEAAFQVVSGKLKRSKATADLTVYITEPGTATAETLWNDYELGAEETPGGLVIKFGVRVTTAGYVLQPDSGKAYPGRGFFGVIRSMREKYGATIIVQEDKERIDIDQLL
jgi:hypothetical protein